MKNQNKNLLTFLFGAAIGAAITWLFTSEDGKKIITDTKEKSKKIRDEVLQRMNDSGTNSNQTS
jgi:gas vesicle protein